MAFTEKPTIECTPPANAGEGARIVPTDILHCGACGTACGTVLDAGFDPRMHGMAVRHAACASRQEGAAQ